MSKCSICGMEASKTNPIIEGLDVSICKSCIKIANELVYEMEALNSGSESLNLVKPKIIKAKLDEYVVGQEHAKVILSAAIYNHYKRVFLKSPIEIQKTNILLIGPSGCGKTHIVKKLSEIINVPMVTVDATSFTEAGYVGEDVESILKKLYNAADQDITKAEQGIVYIDEVDKLMSKISTGERDVNGTGVQQALLKIIESSIVDITVRDTDSPDGKMEIPINTQNILFICGGAFIGLDKIVEDRIKRGGKPKNIGFSNNENSEIDTEVTKKEITSDDIIKYGFLPELVGRLPIILELEKLSKEDLKNVFLTPKDAIFKQYKNMFKNDGINLTISEDAIELIIGSAIKKSTGARGLRNVSEKYIYQLIYDAVDSGIKEITISKEMLEAPSTEAFKYIKKEKYSNKALKNTDGSKTISASK